MTAEIQGNKIVIPFEIAFKGTPSGANKPTEKEGQIIAEGNLQDFDPSKGPGAKKYLTTVAAGFGGEAALTAQLTTLAPYLAEVLIAYGMADYIYKDLQKPGGPLDTRFQRRISQEQEPFLSRQEQAARRYGLDGTNVIIASMKGFGTKIGGAGVGSILKDVKEVGVSKIGLRDKAFGWRP